MTRALSGFFRLAIWPQQPCWWTPSPELKCAKRFRSRSRNSLARLVLRTAVFSTTKSKYAQRFPLAEEKCEVCPRG